MGFARVRSGSLAISSGVPPAQWPRMPATLLAVPKAEQAIGQRSDRVGQNTRAGAREHGVHSAQCVHPTGHAGAVPHWRRSTLVGERFVTSPSSGSLCPSASATSDFTSVRSRRRPDAGDVAPKPGGAAGGRPKDPDVGASANGCADNDGVGRDRQMTLGVARAPRLCDRSGREPKPRDRARPKSGARWVHGLAASLRGPLGRRPSMESYAGAWPEAGPLSACRRVP
jgi:hypothetical protein